MKQEALDFLQEARALHRLIAARPTTFLNEATLFKGWTVEEIVRHLHVWNVMADLSRTDPEAFAAQIEHVGAGIMSGTTRQVERQVCTLHGRPLIVAWQDRYERMGAEWALVDPRLRLKWVGPDLSARTSISASIMEVWAHGQAVFDIAGVSRSPTPRLWNIVALGLNTFGWSHQVNGYEVPPAMPLVRLTLGQEVREWGDQTVGRIEGPAEAFAQVVTQTRSIADVPLTVMGDVAQRWMQMVQCFAGPRNAPPSAGTRHIAQTG
ncbi:maleylpyruvate isomerase family mycothiol-dependent enzyme [Pontivivens nitratireducens]|uniref:Maleylpyruvate isomerase family mycothiol-dependent enzyme n=1 Tax=Pontivivens nitratireducens TaxID=2758038 RepID=A0A6G7VLC0_9RHOB|nr:maleylpyruvate isomerase family mycothiol-dependent enzyme [Pontibrevibacter nitratireducens]QIK40732.1 maleylpyruvate isomerase family mycothiol-dependent enzyme [Pontibrevibacter nitratireducens]